MFKTILVPTDGSPPERAILGAVMHAKETDASLAGLSVTEPYPLSPLSGDTFPGGRMPVDQPQEAAMQTINWSQDMSLGVDDMDAAHKEFLEDLTELLTMPDDRFAPAFMRMIDKVEKEFHDEEDLMEEIDYPGLQEHREQHARVLGALHHVAPHVMNGDVALGREAAELLPQWFLFHLSTMDTALAFALDLDATDINPATIRLAAERIRQGSDRST